MFAFVPARQNIFITFFYYLLYELLLFTWRFCLLLQVWNYLLLLGICALFKKQEHFFFFIMDKMLRWLEVISIWLSEIFIVPFILCTRFLASFFSPYCHNVEFSMCLPFHLYARSKQRLFQFQVIKINWTFDLISKSCLSCFFDIEGWEGEKRREQGVEASVQMIELLPYFLSVLMGGHQERNLIWGGHVRTSVMLSRCSSPAYIP